LGDVEVSNGIALTTRFTKMGVGCSPEKEVLVGLYIVIKHLLDRETIK
jgi:hypothetical protein